MPGALARVKKDTYPKSEIPFYILLSLEEETRLNFTVPAADSRQGPCKARPSASIRTPR